MPVSSTVQDGICNFSKIISTNPPKNIILHERLIVSIYQYPKG